MQSQSLLVLSKSADHSEEIGRVHGYSNKACFVISFNFWRTDMHIFLGKRNYDLFWNKKASMWKLARADTYTIVSDGCGGNYHYMWPDINALIILRAFSGWSRGTMWPVGPTVDVIRGWVEYAVMGVLSWPALNTRRKWNPLEDWIVPMASAPPAVKLTAAVLLNSDWWSHAMACMWWCVG